MHRFSTRILVSVTALAFFGCDRTKHADVDMAPPPAAKTTAPTAPTAPPAEGDAVSGTVGETMNSGGYTYARLDGSAGQVWVAGPETKLTVGQVIGNVGGAVMNNFHSDTLNRTFDRIYFIPSFSESGAATSPHAGATPTGTPPVSVEPVGKIEPAAGGQTVAQVFAGKAALSGKPVVVRGKVVKVNEGILGRNWIHLQDGSGAAGTNDLTVTYATGTVAKGDVVVVRGTVAIDKDFGAGYAYDVIVEDATIAAK